jgi:simple sugar transport system ATP-binding protein
VSVLEIRDIHKSFGALDVIKGVSLAFQPGTVTALVGDNGAGKTTLLKLIAGIYTLDSGSLFLEEHDLSRAEAGTRRSLGIEMVYQDLALARNQDVITNLYLGIERVSLGGFLRRDEMRARGQHLLKEMGINLPALNRPVGAFSGGQQQAIAIARAVMFNPKVLLLDEPTAALAAREVESTLALINKQRDAGRVVILVSHRLNDVMAVSDRIVVLKHGQVLTDDPTASVSLSQVVERIVS